MEENTIKTDRFKRFWSTHDFSCWLFMDVYPALIPGPCAQHSMEGHQDPGQDKSQSEIIPEKPSLVGVAGRGRGDLALMVMKYCPLLLWPVGTEDTC